MNCSSSRAPRVQTHLIAYTAQPANLVHKHLASPSRMWNWVVDFQSAGLKKEWSVLRKRLHLRVMQRHGSSQHTQSTTHTHTHTLADYLLAQGEPSAQHAIHTSLPDTPSLWPRRRQRINPPTAIRILLVQVTIVGALSTPPPLLVPR